MLTTAHSSASTITSSMVRTSSPGTVTVNRVGGTPMSTDTR